MITSIRERVYVPILVISATAWTILVINPERISLTHCPVTDSGPSLVSFQMALAMNPISSLTLGWALMLVAMMSPTLIEPIRHIRERSFKRRRARAVMLFVVTYGAVWMAGGGVLLATMLLLHVFLPQSYLPAAVVGTVAFIWQCSPVKQRCLNRGHNHRELAAFGMAADLDVVSFGLMHALWCVGSCWALMLLPMLVLQGHFVAMALVTFVMNSERLERPRPVNWRLRFSGKLMRIVVSQTRIRLQSKVSASVIYS